MRLNIIITAFATLALLSGCNSDSGQQTQAQETDERVPILLSAGVGDEARAGQGIQNTQFKKGQSMDVQITSKDNMTGYDLLTYFAADNAGSLQPSKGVYPYYPTNGANVDIRSIYPTGYMNGNDFAVAKLNQTGQEAYMASDLMFAKLEDVERTTSAVQLTFHHLMTKICVNLTGEGGVVLTNSTVKLLNVKTETTYNALTGVVKVADAKEGSESDILMTNNGAQGCAAIIVPQTKGSGYLLEIILQNNDVLHYKTVQDIIFESGKVYTFNVKVIESNISVETTVAAWETTTDVEERLKL